MKKINPMLIGIIPFFIFGLSFLFTKVALEQIGNVFHVLGLRMLLAALTLIILRAIGLIKVNFKGKSIKPLLLIALLQPILYFTFETIGIKHSTTSITGVMIAFIPIVVTILAVIFLKEKTNILQIGFIATSILGIILINSDLSISGDNFIGLLMLTGAVFTAAVYQILSRKASYEYSSIEITYVMMIVGAIFFNGIGLYTLLKEGILYTYFTPLLDINLLLPLLYLGVLSSVVAFFIINYVLSQVSATKAAILANLTTIVAILAGVIFLNESFAIIKVLGSLMILIGVYGTTKVQVE